MERALRCPDQAHIFNSTFIFIYLDILSLLKKDTDLRHRNLLRWNADHNLGHAESVSIFSLVAQERPRKLYFAAISIFNLLHIHYVPRQENALSTFNVEHGSVLNWNCLCDRSQCVYGIQRILPKYGHGKSAIPGAAELYSAIYNIFYRSV